MAENVVSAPTGYWLHEVVYYVTDEGLEEVVWEDRAPVVAWGVDEELNARPVAWGSAVGQWYRLDVCDAGCSFAILELPTGEYFSRQGGCGTQSDVEQLIMTLGRHNVTQRKKDLERRAARGAAA